MNFFRNGLCLKNKLLTDTDVSGSTSFTIAIGIKKNIEAITLNKHLEL